MKRMREMALDIRQSPLPISDLWESVGREGAWMERC